MSVVNAEQLEHEEQQIKVIIVYFLIDSSSEWLDPDEIKVGLTD